jgi:mannose-6-phosphate isomerase-like protein (cupin superfamily)
MSDPIRRPSRVTLDQARMRSVTADGGFRLGVLIDAVSHRSPLLFGLAWIEAGTAPVSWEQDALTHETYYILSGTVKVSWEEPDPGETVLQAGDSFYLPPARRYCAENPATEQAFLAWSLWPSQAR